MIDILIKYIQDKGYEVHVIPGVLLIRKRVGDQRLGVDWAISSFDLQPEMEDILFDQADQRIALIEQAISR